MTDIGYCVPCRTPQCHLPAVITVTFSGLENDSRKGPLSQAALGNPSRTRPNASVPPHAAVDPVIYAINGPDVGPIDDVVLVGSLDPLKGFSFYGREQPVVRATNNTGHGATFEVTLEEATDFYGFPIWRIASVSVGGNGYGYTNSAMIFLVPEGDSCQRPAIAGLVVARAQPTLVPRITVDACDCDTPGGAVGQGARFSLTYSQVNFAAGQERWAVSSVAVVDGGRGYADGSSLLFDLGPGDVQQAAAVATVQASDGVITAVTLASGGVYYKAGVPQSVQVSTSTFPRQDGEYYRQNKSLGSLTPSTLGDSTLFTSRESGSPVTGPDLAVTVNEDLDSDTFGEMTAVSVASSGTNTYRQWADRRERCFDSLNGVPIRLADALRQKSVEDELLWVKDLHHAVVLCAESSFGTPPTLSFRQPIEDSPGLHLDDPTYDHLETGIDEVFVESPGEQLATLARVEPVCTLSGWTGSGVAYELLWEPEFSAHPDNIKSRGLPTWRLAGVNITARGSGFTDFDDKAVFLQGATAHDLEAVGGSLRFFRLRAEPTATAVTACQSGNATFAIHWLQDQGTVPTWGVNRIEVTQSGSGYAGRVPLLLSPTGGSVQQEAACAYGIANQAGAIVSVEVVRPGKYFKRTDKAGHVRIVQPPSWYRETTALPALVADVAVFVKQFPPSHGSGAQFSVTIDDDPDSETFGEAASADVVSAGSDYIFYRHPAGEPFDNCASEQLLLLYVFVRAQLLFNITQNACVFVVYLTSSEGTMVFAAPVGDEESFNTTSRTVTLPALQHGVTATATIEWGGTLDPSQQICGCCDIEGVPETLCDDPIASGWPPVGYDPVLYTDPMGLVFPRSCNGFNRNGDFVANNEVILWEATFDANDEFAGWHLLCGACAEEIQVGVDANGPVYSDQPLPGFDLEQRNQAGLTFCSCNVDAEFESRCVWRPSTDGECWNGEYTLVAPECENPLP